MPLRDTGNRAQTPIGENALANDGDGNRVVVAATTEAIRDYGWGAILTVASAKYDSGDVEDGASVPTVRVSTTDCKAG